MEDLFKDHHVALFCVNLGALILGLPLSLNVLRHLKGGLLNCAQSKFFHSIHRFFQVATNKSGRGVLRLLLIQQQINLICIPAICLQLLLFANPSINVPQVICLSIEIMHMIVTLNRVLGDTIVALGR